MAGVPSRIQGRSRVSPTVDEGWRVEVCPGGSECPNALVEPEKLVESIRGLFIRAGFTDYVRKKAGGTLLFHQQFSVSVSCCPNACSQPQIKDVGIVGEVSLKFDSSLCDLCLACVDACEEGALCARNGVLELDRSLCVGCGVCIRSCDSGALRVERRGYRLLLGGKLGRHPRLATPLAGLLDEGRILSVVLRCIDLYMKEASGRDRLGDVLERLGWDRFAGLVTI